MSNFSKFTPEWHEEFERKQLARRLSQAKPAPSKQPKAGKAQPEYQIQAGYVRDMGIKHPEIMVFSDTAAHIKKTIIQQKRANALQSGKEKWPDVFVAQPSGDYAGLYLEFKAECPFKKSDGKLLSSEHVEAQAETMRKLRNRGYYCAFVWSVDLAIAITEMYLNGETLDCKF